MFNYEKTFLDAKSEQTGFVRYNLEKVYRLIDVLNFINNDPFLSGRLALKGGTAINLVFFDLPRLSVDIDLDYMIDCDRETMLVERKQIEETLTKHMLTQGYFLSTKRNKDVYALGSKVFYYQSIGGNNDNIKVEINYAIRNHLFPSEKHKIHFLDGNLTTDIRTLTPFELFGSKIKALLERTASRDLYDVYNMINFGLFQEEELEQLKNVFCFTKRLAAQESFLKKLI